MSDIVERLRAKQRGCKGSARMDAWRTYRDAADAIEEMARALEGVLELAEVKRLLLHLDMGIGTKLQAGITLLNARAALSKHRSGG